MAIHFNPGQAMTIDGCSVTMHVCDGCRVVIDFEPDWDSGGSYSLPRLDVIRNDGHMMTDDEMPCDLRRLVQDIRRELHR